jgi:nitrogen fixation protein NifB
MEWSGIAVKDIRKHHPCFNEEAHDRVGRIHLPIAPRCNIQCNFCEHRVCTEIQHPGWTAKVLSVAEAVDFVRTIVKQRQKYDFIVGVAGPGDALANEQTFQTLRLISQEYPQLTTCLCTNGLLLEDKLEDMVKVGVKALTVTVNAANSQIGKHIYSWTKYQGTIYRGEEAASLLIEKQFSGIAKAIAAGLSLKVNSVLVPGVNDEHMPELALRLQKIGVELMNIMPLIPAGRTKDFHAPGRDELQKARLVCDWIIPQFHRCEQCRADVVYLP